MSTSVTLDNTTIFLHKRNVGYKYLENYSITHKTRIKLKGLDYVIISFNHDSTMYADEDYKNTWDIDRLQFVKLKHGVGEQNVIDIESFINSVHQ